MFRWISILIGLTAAFHASGVATAQVPGGEASSQLPDSSVQPSDSSVQLPDSSVHFGHVRYDSTRNAWHASLAGSGHGRYFCAWTERRPSSARIRGAFLSRGQRSGFRAIDVGRPPAGAEDERPAVVFLTDSTVLVCWQRRDEGRHVLRACTVALSGACGEEADVSDAGGGCMMPAAGRSGDGGVLLAWQDYRNGNADVYARRFDAQGRPLGASFPVSDDSGTAMQGAPRIAADNRDRFLLFWPDNREDGAWKFYYRRIGAADERDVLIDSAQRKAMTTQISGVCLGSDSAMFAWKDYREGHSNIYIRRADLRSGMLSSARRINDDTGDRWQRLAVIDADARGGTVVCWEDYRNTEINQRGDIYLQAFAPDGSPLGGNMRVNDRDDRIARKMPQLVMDGDGEYLVVWHQGEDGRFHLAGQWLRYPERRSGANFCLTCDDTSKE